MNPNPPVDAAELRCRAEDRLQTRERTPQSAPDTQRLVHELQVHQIELEMQNEELRQARAQLCAHVAQYIDLFEFAPTGYLTLDREGVIRQANLAAARLFGVERSRLLKRRFGLFVAEGDRGAFSDFLQRVFAEQAKARCGVTLPQAGHHPLSVRIEGTRSADGQECLAVVVDLTERTRVDEAFRLSQQRLSLHVEQTPLAMIDFDLEGRVREWNPAAVAVFGYSLEEAVGQHWSFIVPATFHEQVDGVWAAIVAQRGGSRSTNENITKDGRTIGCEWFNTPLIARDGRTIGVASLIEDITERKATQDALRKSNAILRAINEEPPT